ncbi:MAG: methyl-accepting chemotaxis protein [Pseudomonadota bacterium]
MALVKKTQVAKTATAVLTTPPLPARRIARQAATAAPETANGGFKNQMSKRLAATATELASGIHEAAAAATELQRSVEEISGGAEESSGAAQESLRAVAEMSRGLTLIRTNAETSQQEIQRLQLLINAVSSTITEAITDLNVAAERQYKSKTAVRELEKQVIDISEIVKVVAWIADQTNLLALNAAIEAARAGRHGKGFGVIAEEVRSLADSSEKSTREIQTLVEQIQEQVGIISQGIEVAAEKSIAEIEKGKLLNVQLDEVNLGIQRVALDGENISMLAQESATSAVELEKGAEMIAAAAEEQANAAEQCARMMAEQTVALSQSNQGSQELARIADDVTGRTIENSEEVATVADQLSAAIEEINRAAVQIRIALAQISKGAQQQSVAAEESSTAATQIEKGAQTMESRARQGVDNILVLHEALTRNKLGISQMISGILAAVTETERNIGQARILDQFSQRIDKTVNGIASIAIQTNMLAVSGAIEAARAGEHGKGFVGVSSDIRSLSRDAADQVERIKDLIANVRSQIQSVLITLNQIVAATIKETEKTQRVMSNIDAVTVEMDKVQARLLEIVAMSTSMTRTLNEVKVGSEQIATVVVEADRAATQAVSAANQQSQAAEELAAAIEEIASLANSLYSSKAPS